MRTVVVLFNRDLRVHDHPALATACREAERVVPLFVLDEDILRSSFGAPNRVAFLLDCLGDLRENLRSRGGTLVVREGDVVEETMRVVDQVDADALFASADHTHKARLREDRLRAACAARNEFRTFPGVAVVDPGVLRPSGGESFRVFTPYWRRWEGTEKREPLGAPRSVRMPRVAGGVIPRRQRGSPAPDLPPGGEAEGRRVLKRWLSSGLSRYEELRDDLGADATSHLSPFLHFGALSPA